MSPLARSPHGSRSWELIKFIANRVLTARQRHLIKSILRIGVQSGAIPEFRDELERIKSRQTILDSKFNLAIHGLPTETQTKVVLLSNSLLAGLGDTPDLDEFIGDVLRKHAPPRQKLEPLLKPGKSGVIGADFPEFIQLLAPNAGSWVADSSDSRLKQVQAMFPSTRTLRTDPLTCVLSHGNSQLDQIVCLWRFHHLTPREQIRFVQASAQALASGGTLLLLLPRIESKQYWLDPRALRPYSTALLREMFQRIFGNEGEHHDLGPDHIAYRVRKFGS